MCRSEGVVIQSTNFSLLFTISFSLKARMLLSGRGRSASMKKKDGNKDGTTVNRKEALIVRDNQWPGGSKYREKLGDRIFPPE
jgi:hypothetical protein